MWSCMARVWPCPWEGCCCNWCIWLIQDEFGPIKFSLALTSFPHLMAVILLPINTSGSSPGKQCPSLLMYDYLMKQRSVPMTFWGLPLPPHLQLMWQRPSEGMLPISFLWHQLSRSLYPAAGRYWRGPAVYSDSCKQCNVPVHPDQPCGLHCLAPLFCSSSVDSPDMSVPVHSFSSLTLVHLVSPLQFSQFQAEHHFRLGQPRGPSGGRRGLMARLQVGHAFGVFMLPRLGVGSSSLQVPRDPISMCDSHVKPL